MDLFGFLVIVMIIFIIIAAIKLINTSQNKKEMEEDLNHLTNFDATQKFMGVDGISGIAIDEDKKEICIIKKKGNDFALDVISYNDLLSSEIFEDGKTITRSSRASQLGSALIGGLAFGGIGAIVGGLSGSKTSTHKVSKVDLRITINKTNAPIHDVNFMNFEGKGTEIVYPGAIQRARHWHSLLEVIISRTDAEDKLNENRINQNATETVVYSSVADELSKLVDLKNQGIITEEEFASQKTKLLS